GRPRNLQAPAVGNQRPPSAVACAGGATMKLQQTACALVLLLAAAVAPAAAQTAGITEPSTALRLTAQQRSEIYAAVGKNKLRTPPPADLPVAVGAQIPPV